MMGMVSEKNGSEEMVRIGWFDGIDLSVVVVLWMLGG
jgi:hypothetical protein